MREITVPDHSQRARSRQLRGIVTWARGLILTGLALVPALALYTLTAPWPDTPDGLFHLHRTRALAEALRWGILYPRWFPDFAFGYGYPVLNFYAPAFYYPPALLHLLGLDLITATRVALAAWYALSGWAAYRLLRRWVRTLPALAGAALYLTYPYHLYDLFVRGALPEFAAFLWPPLLVWTLLRARDALTAPGRHTPARLVWPALAWAGLLLTHNLTALMVGLLLAGYLVLRIGVAALREPGERTASYIGGYALPLALGTLLAGFYVAPALAEMSWVGIGSGEGGAGYTRHLISLARLFTWDRGYAYPAAADPTVPTPGYVAVILGMSGLLWLGYALRRHRPATFHALTLGLIIALLTLWLTTEASRPLWQVFDPLLGKLQFPWRWHALVALALAVLLGFILDALFSPSPQFLEGVLTLALVLFFTLYSISDLTITPAPYTAADLTPAQMWAFDREHGQVGASWTGEFLPRWVSEQRWAIGREPSEPQRAAAAAALEALTPTRVRYLGLRAQVRAARSAEVVFHTFYYPAWQVLVDGRAVATRAVSNLGLLAATVPAGTHTLTLRWGPTPAVWLGRLLTFMGWAGTAGLFLLGRRRRPALVAWLLVGLLGLIAATNGLAREDAPRIVAARYGPLTLEAASIPQARAGTTATVRLYWLIRAGTEPVTAFVHVVDARGRVVAQHDAPPGGPYTPPSRWWPGLLLPDDHPIPLPPDLPPGTYTLKAGLYRPGYADQPLHYLGVDPADPRVTLGTLEVLP